MVQVYRRTICALLGMVLLGVAFPALAEKPAKLPKDRVLAMYFHRTNRCPTCRKISAYIEEAIQKGFVEELKQKRVGLVLVDYQDKKNEKHTKYYRIERPTLVIAEVHDGKVAQWKQMPKVWGLVGKKKDFLKYVQDGVQEYLDKKEAAASASVSGK
jgi:thiol-disulfide isomerase/thioredoxin